MAKGISINMGLNFVDPDGYEGWDGELSGCHNDAKAMQQIAVKAGFKTTLMLDEQCSSNQMCTVIGQAAKDLESGDICFISFSGHGGQFNDVDGDEIDSLDETWCAWDRQVVDDELYQLYSQFKAGVRILVLSDSCHSGTVAKMVRYGELALTKPLSKDYHRNGVVSRSGAKALPPRFRAIPKEVQDKVYRKHKEMYDARQWAVGGKKGALLDASLILISGCLDNQLSSDGDVNGLFTEKVLEVWNSGSFEGTYETFWKAILAKMPPTQSPNYYTLGTVDASFRAEKPFTIGQTVYQPGTSSRPIITGPTSWASTSDSPDFQVNTQGAPYYVAEFATKPELFDLTNHGTERTTSNFYGSWSDSSRLTSSFYPMPRNVWQALKVSGRIYYRVGTTTSATGWDNYTTSTSDSDLSGFPSIQITGGSSATTDNSKPSIEGPSSLSRDDNAPTFEVHPGNNPYYIVEVATNPVLFDYTGHNTERSDKNFYATWLDTPVLSSPTFTLNEEVWDRMVASAERLYYRIGTTSSTEGWDNYTVSVSDSQPDMAPAIQITG